MPASDISTPQLAPLIGLCHFRWAIPVISELQKSSGAKFVTMQKRLGVSPDALRRSLDYLIAANLIQVNSGYGHPMRPEYILSKGGQAYGSCSAGLYSELQKQSVEQLCLKKWSIPALVGIEAGHSRFNDIKRLLPGATSRAVTQALKNLTHEGLLIRIVTDDYPPAVNYKTSKRGNRIAVLASKLSGTSYPSNEKKG